MCLAGEVEPGCSIDEFGKGYSPRWAQVAAMLVKICQTFELAGVLLPQETFLAMNGTLRPLVDTTMA